MVAVVGAGIVAAVVEVVVVAAVASASNFVVSIFGSVVDVQAAVVEVVVVAAVESLPSWFELDGRASISSATTKRPFYCQFCTI